MLPPGSFFWTVAKAGLSGLAFVSVVFIEIWPAPAAAQTQAPPAAGRDPYITSTGETVAKPGQSQSGGTTDLDRKIQRENDTIDKSICKGC